MKRGIDLKKKKRQIGTGLVTACLIVVMGAGPAAAEAALLYADQTKTEETADESAQEETEIWQEETESWSDVSETQTERKTQTKTSPDKSSASLKAPVITTRINGERPAFSWKPVKGAAAYEVWRKDEGAWKKTVLKGKYWIYFSDRKAAVGHPVRYKVRAVGRDKSCSDFSPVIKLVKHPDIPAILSLKKTRISWHKVTGADYYQIYIMGHSCGNSDRTLLNTLFEHKNCVSIKPYYYQKTDGTDNYMEIVQNICRNFTDMKLMRDRVVNKTFCKPLPQISK